MGGLAGATQNSGSFPIRNVWIYKNG